MVDRKEVIAATDFEIGWLEQQLQSSLNTTALISSIEQKRIAIGQGLLSG